MPGTIVKSTQIELLYRIDFTAQLLGAMLTEGQIRRKLTETYGICRRQCDRYLARARKLIRERTGMSRFEHACESDAFYRSEMTRTNDPIVRIKCRERLDSIHGVDAKYEGGPAKPPLPAASPKFTVNVSGMPVDEIERRVEAGERINLDTIEHLPRQDQLRVIRKAALALRPPNEEPPEQ